MAGRCPAITLATTLAPRVWRITWITTSSFWNTQFQQVRPSMRTPVSSEQTARARRSRAKMAAVSASKRGLAAPERRIQRALTDGEAEQLQQQPAQPAVADVVGEAQVHRQRDDVQTERR